MQFLLLSTIFGFVSSTPQFLAELDSQNTIKVLKDERVYFMAQSATGLDKITVTAANSQISTNVAALAATQSDGSINPLIITADTDTIVVTRPASSLLQVSVYISNITSKLNVFPVFESTNVQFKSGINAFFGYPETQGKILTMQNLNLTKASGDMVAYSGLPDDPSNSHVFFQSNAFSKNKFYNQLNMPLDFFYLSQIDSGVTYQVSLQTITTEIAPSGVLMTANYPYMSTIQYTTTELITLYSNGRNVKLEIQLHFNDSTSYDVSFTRIFQDKHTENTLFNSRSSNNKNYEYSGNIVSLLITNNGPYAVQYYITDNGSGSLHLILVFVYLVFWLK